MRKFTKDHNDIRWLFPDPLEHGNDPNSWYDLYESQGKELLEKCYGNKEVFTKDDIMDAFMKGASVGHQFLGSEVAGHIDSEKFYKETLEKQEETLKLLENLEKKLENK